MDIILKENVDGLGIIGEQVSVKPGYARNYLLPKGLAIVADMASVKELEHQKRQLARKLEKATKDAEAIKARIEKVACEFTQRAGEEGKLFGSVGTADIADAVNATGNKVEKREIRMPEGAIRQVGEYDIDVELHSDVVATMKINIVAE